MMIKKRSTIVYLSLSSIPLLVLAVVLWGEKLAYDLPRFENPVVQSDAIPGGYLPVKWQVVKVDDCPGRVQVWALDAPVKGASGYRIAEFPLSWPVGTYERVAQYPMPPTIPAGEYWLEIIIDHDCGIAYKKRQRVELVPFKVRQSP